jgi:hypothetical protein
MKQKLVFSILTIFIFLGSQAQELASIRRVAVVSPEIGEKTIIFRIQAPQAKLVRLYGSWMRSTDSSVNMTKDSLDVWSVSIAKPASELYTYNFIVDGLSVIDVNNIVLQRDGTRYLSVLLVPGDIAANYFEATKHGNLSKVWYDSPTIGKTRRMYVYTPYTDMKQVHKVIPFFIFYMVVVVMRNNGVTWDAPARYLIILLRKTLLCL